MGSIGIALLGIIAPILMSCYAEDAEELQRKGSALLQQVISGDDSQLVAATEYFARAAAAYTSKGDESGAQQANACLYWSKKRMTLKQIDTFVAHSGNNTDVQNALKTVDAKVEADQADAYFERAEAFAKSHPADNLHISLLYFEIADRFIGSPQSIKAQQLSLAAMQKIRIDPFGAPEPATDEETLKLPAVVKVYAAFGSAVVKAKGRYSKQLTAVAKAVQKEGNLETLHAIETELESLKLNSDTSYAKIDNAGSSLAQDSYNKEVAAARQDLIHNLESAVGDEVRKNHIPVAERLQALVRNLRAVLDDPSILGTYSSAGYGPWVIAYANSVVQLQLNDSHSIETFKIDGNYLFHWSNGNDGMWLEHRPNGYFISCYSRYFDKLKGPPVKPAGKPFFSEKLNPQK